jgi:hypothetical protein
MAEKEPRRIAWVLGSGFSKSLGGPLLDDLLSERGRRIASASLGAEDHSTVYDLFHAWHRKARPSIQQGAFWDDAEDYLEYLGLAASKAPGAERAASLVRGILKAPDFSVEVLHRRAVRALAAETLFTLGADTRMERWDPYVRWASHLTGNDTIITFNWDLVLETLGEAQTVGYVGQESVLYPLECGIEPQGISSAWCKILKMHGSVNWFNGKSPPPSGTVPSDYAHVQLFNGDEPILGTPGPLKADRRRGAFSAIWGDARDALSKANVVVFLGYRFPPSDSNSRRELLEALGGNRNRFVTIHTVLGSRTSDEHTVRLVRLLEHTLEGAEVRQADGQTRRRSRKSTDPGAPSFQIEAHPMNVEDFISVVRRDAL